MALEGEYWISGSRPQGMLESEYWISWSRPRWRGRVDAGDLVLDPRGWLGRVNAGYLVLDRSGVGG